MTPEQIDTVTDGLITTWQLVGTYGPGLAVAASAWAAWAATKATRRAAARIRTRRELRRIENYANHKLARHLHSPDRKEKP